MMNKEELMVMYLSEYSSDNRFEFCKLALMKYNFHKYPISIASCDIRTEDFIVHDEGIRLLLSDIIETGECSVDNFKNIFNKLSQEQIEFIGF